LSEGAVLSQPTINEFNMYTFTKLCLALCIFFPLISTAETITISNDEMEFFHHVMCTSDARAQIELLETATDKHKDDIAKLKKLAESSKALAIAAGEKANRKEAYVLQFIELKTQTSIKANKSYIEKRGFEAFSATATSSLFKMCGVND